MFLCYKPSDMLRVNLIDKTSYSPNLDFSFTCASNEYIMYYVVFGKILLCENDFQFELNNGRIFFLLPKCNYKIKTMTDTTIFAIHIPTNNFTEFDCQQISDVQQMIINNKNLSFSYSPMCSELYDNANILIPRDICINDKMVLNNIELNLEEAYNYSLEKYEYYKTICSCCALRVITSIATYYNSIALNQQTYNTKVLRNAKKVESVLSILHKEYMNKLTGNYIAKKTNQNFDYLNRIFKEQTNKTIFSYLNTIRINEAKTLIVNGNSTFSEIAAKTGFCDEYHFNKAFKKETGTPPGKWFPQ